jgi:hypothetical protein
MPTTMSVSVPANSTFTSAFHVAVVRHILTRLAASTADSPSIGQANQEKCVTVSTHLRVAAPQLNVSNRFVARKVEASDGLLAGLVAAFYRLSSGRSQQPTHPCRVARPGRH